MGRSVTPRSLLNYTVCAVVLILGYKFFYGADDSPDPFRSGLSQHPRRLQKPLQSQEGEEEGPPWKEEVERGGDTVEGQGEQGGVRMDVGDLPKNLEREEEGEDLMNQKQKKYFKDQFDKQAGDKTEAGDGKKKEKKFFPDGVDWELEEEMKKRRAAFFEGLAKRDEPLEENEFKDMHESDSNFPFVTAGSHSTFPATVQFVYSVQYFYPLSQIAVYDIGLTSDEKTFLNSLCNTEVQPMWLQLWPEKLYKIRHRVWRTLLLQFAFGRFGHFVYLEPGRFVYKQGIKDYITQSRLHGLTVGGRQLKYSSYVVTNPHMYSFLKIDERKLQKTPHFDFTMLVLHNTKRVNHYFMRYLMACAMEEYCISPPGSKPNCDFNLNMASNKRYAHCHRYDESAINLILNTWHDYTPRQFLMKDLITRYYDGRDMTKRVKVCNHSDNKDEV